jgi:hypothetical protein
VSVMKPTVKKLLPIIIISALGMITVLVATAKYGPGITHDSVAYLYAAKTLLNGRGLEYFGYGTPFVQWPPLFPSLIAAVGFPGIDMIQAVRWINSMAFGFIVLFSSLWLLKNVKNYLLVLLGTTTTLLSIPLLQVSRYAWSEPVFILFILLFLIALHKYFTRNQYKFLIISAVFASMACMTRYLGVIAAFTGVMLLLIQSGKLRSRLSNILLFGAISGLPMVVWFLRNYMVFSTITGSRTASQIPLMYNAALAISTLVSWFLPSANIPVILSVLVIMFIFFIAAVAAVVRRIKHTIVQTDFIKGGLKLLMPNTVMPAFIIFYVLYLVIAASFAAFDPIGDRLLSPVFVPLVLWVFHMTGRLYDWMEKAVSVKAFRYILAVLIFLWLILPASAVCRIITGSVSYGAGGYASDSWQGSELMQYVSKIPEDCIIYSNYPDAIYLFTGRSALYTPKTDTDIYEYSLEKFKESVNRNKRSYIIWFDKNIGNWLYNIEGLGRYFNMEEVVQVEDGAVYVIK